MALENTSFPWKKITILLVVGVVVALFAGYLWFNGQKPVAGPRAVPVDVNSLPRENTPLATPYRALSSQSDEASQNPSASSEVLPTATTSQPSSQSEVATQKATPSPFAVSFIEGENPYLTDGEAVSAVTSTELPGEVCGNYYCSANEKASNACCQDCGCFAGVCSLKTQTCIAPLAVSDSFVSGVVDRYVKDSGFDLNSMRVVDATYDGHPVKEAILDCGSDSQIVCQTILTIDGKGKILEVAQAN